MDRGILGGTFDPPHLAHLFAAEIAYRDLSLDIVTFLPAGAPWQKADTEVSVPEHRLAMTELAIAPARYFEVDDREVRRDGWTYTVDTLATFPEADQLTLILGADAAAGIPSWHRGREVLERVRLAVAPRPGVDRAHLESSLAGAQLTWLDAPALDVSGTMLRSRVRSGLSVRFLVADGVWRYIAEHGLYGSSVAPAT